MIGIKCSLDYVGPNTLAISCIEHAIGFIILILTYLNLPDLII